MIARLYKGRYYRSSTFLQSESSRQALYGWKSIQIGKELLQKGLRVHIGDGQTTNIWKDKWLPTLSPTAISGDEIDSSMTVSDLWTHEWNEDIMRTLLQARPVGQTSKTIA